MLWLGPVTDAARLRRFALGVIAVFVAFPLAYAAIELFEPALRDRPKATQFPGQHMADLVTKAWRDKYRHAAPLRRRFGVRRQQSGGLFARPAPRGGARPAAIAVPGST